MAAGRLRDRITVERQTTTEDEFGNTVGGWSALLTLWADVRETPGKERIAAGRLEASRTATIRVRKSAQSDGITAADRIVYRGATWNITSAPVEVSNRGAMLELLCVAAS
tara:strand:+ start:284 stop:613 length:330 start_codon:yes stop_codon:yes gene_type:complete